MEERTANNQRINLVEEDDDVDTYDEAGETGESDDDQPTIEERSDAYDNR